MATVYALAKKLGIYPQAIVRGIRRGKLPTTATEVDGKTVITDLDKAVAEWNANSDHSKSPLEMRAHALGAADGAEPGSMLEASAAEKHWKAKLAELKFKEAAGELIQARDVERRMIDAFTACKTKLLSVPSRVRQALPGLTVADTGTIENLIREALEDLSGD